MKHLYLLRHGEAEPIRVGITDENRPLTGNGITQIRNISARFKEKAAVIDCCIASPAVRARQTAEYFLREMSPALFKIEYLRTFYTEATLGALLHALRSCDENISRLLVVAHNPMLEETASHFCPSFNERIPPAGLIAITMPRTAWKTLHPGDAVIDFFLKPQ